MSQTAATGTLVAPVEQDGRFRFRAADVELEIAPAVGGRITAFKLDGIDVLVGPDVHPENFGSTFWTSPQSDWGWPPTPEIDHAPYAAAIDGATLVVRGGPSRALGVQVTKRFSMRDDGAVTIEYQMRNSGEAPVKRAPWEITRVAPNGLTFFPTGAGAFPPSSLSVEDRDGFTWFKYDATAITADQKLFADASAGWIAHVDANRVLVKRFPKIPRDEQAPGEAEVELYANPAHTYVEIEQQGRYAEIAPGASASWSVEWQLRRLPATVPIAVGSTELIAFVEKMVRL